MVAVLLLGLDQGEWGVGEHGVVAPDAKQHVLAVGGLAVEVFDPADDQPGGDRLPLLRGERGMRLRAMSECARRIEAARPHARPTWAMRAGRVTARGWRGVNPFERPLPTRGPAQPPGPGLRSR